MTRGSDQLLGYGDYNFDETGKSAYIVDLAGPVLLLLWEDRNITNVSCGAVTSGAYYKMAITSNGVNLYKDSGEGYGLICSLAGGVSVDNKSVFFESRSSASYFDDLSVSNSLSAPTELTGTPRDGQIILSWSGSLAAEDYIVEYKPSSSNDWGIFDDGTSSVTSAVITGMTNNCDYDFRVSAANSLGTSFASSVISITPAASAMPIPQTIPNLALWLDGSDDSSISQTDGAVTQITDKSGNGRDAIASGSASPTLVSDVQNNHSVLRFNGSNYLSINNSITYKTIFVIAKFNSSLFNDYNGIIGDATLGHIINGVKETTHFSSGTSDFSAAYKNATKISGTGTGHNFSPIDEYWMGSFIINAGKTNLISTIGSIGWVNREWNGDIGEIIVYDRVLANAERQIMEQYLGNKWNVSISTTIPTAPTISSVKAGDGQATVSFAPGSNGGSSIIGYTVTSSPEGITASGIGSPITVSGLTNGTAYSFSVTATTDI